MVLQKREQKKCYNANMNSSKDRTLHYAMIQFWFWFLSGNLANYASVYFVAKGVSNTNIGFLLAICSVLTIIIETPLGTWADKPKAPSVKMVFMVAIGLVLGFDFLSGQMSEAQSLFAIIFYCAAIVGIQSMNGFVNALATETMNAGYPLRFHVARAFGSVGYAVMSYTIGLFVSHFGGAEIPTSVLFSGAVFLLVLFFFPFEKTKHEHHHQESGSLLVFFKKYKKFQYLFVGCFLIYCLQIYTNSFLYQIVLDKGGDSPELGTTMALAAILELPTMLGFHFLLKRKPSVFWIEFAGVAYIIKGLLTIFVPSFPWFYGVQFFQMFSWAIISVAVVIYTNSIVNEEDKIKSQALMSVAYTASKIFASLTGGVLIDFLSVKGMMIVAVVICVIGTFIIDQLRRMEEA